MTTLENFAHYQVSQTSDGQLMELPRSLGELACLAFDTRHKRLVELRLPETALLWSDDRWQGFCRGAGEWRKNRAARFSHVLDFGRQEGLVYYVTTPTDGEPVLQYVQRRGSLKPAVAVGLIAELTRSLIAAGELDAPLPGLHPGSIMVELQESYFLSLKITDLGLSRVAPEMGPLALLRHVQKSLARLLYLMLSGREAPENPAEGLAEVMAPAELEAFLRHALTDVGGLPHNLEETRQLFLRAQAELVLNLVARQERRHLVALGEDRPQSALQQMLCGSEGLPPALKARFRPDAEQQSLADFYARPMTETQTNRRLNMQFLPGDRMAQSKIYAPLPAGIWKQDPVRHPNLIRAVALWETPDGLFLPEERLTGFSLAWYLKSRLFLNREDAALILQQVKAAIEQAATCQLILPSLSLAPRRRRRKWRGSWRRR